MSRSAEPEHTRSSPKKNFTINPVLANHSARELWARKDTGVLTDHITVTVPRHGAAIFRVSVIE